MGRGAWGSPYPLGRPDGPHQPRREGWSPAEAPLPQVEDSSRTRGGPDLRRPLGLQEADGGVCCPRARGAPPWPLPFFSEDGLNSR